MNKEELMRKYHYGYQTACKLVESQYVKDLNKEIKKLNSMLKATKKVLNDMDDIAGHYEHIINELEKVLNEEVKLRYHGKDDAIVNKIFNAGGMLYRDYIIDTLKELKGEDKDEL